MEIYNTRIASITHILLHTHLHTHENATVTMNA